MRYNVRMYTIVGLGNPGNEYVDTRHNVGWAVLSMFAEKNSFPTFERSSRYSCLIAEGTFEGEYVTILLPTTFMNKSGQSLARYFKDFNRENIDKLIVVHDDVDLLFGTVRVSYDRGAGGHNGIQSIIDTMTTKRFIRIRVGIARKNFFGAVERPRGEALSTFVLGKFTKSEREQLPAIQAKVDEALLLIIGKSVEHAMQEINRE